MSLLNRPSDGLHSVLVAIFKLLLKRGKLPRQELLDLIAPLTLFADQDEDKKQEMAKKTLNRWVQLGLFQKSDSDDISLTGDKKTELTVDSLPSLSRSLALKPENNSDFLDAEPQGAGDFTRAITWLLAQNAWKLDLRSWEDIESLIKQQCPAGLTILQNNTRWSGLKAWSRFLGFAWIAKAPNGEILVPDPTEAVRDTLPQIFGKSKELEARYMVDALAQAIPVLDGGTYRQNLEAELKKTQGPDAWRPPPNGQLSTSLSRALLRLQEEKYIKGEKRADKDAKVRVVLSGRNNQLLQEYSHFNLIG
jgi:hypothetical protein